MIENEMKFDSMVFYKSWISAMKRMTDTEFRATVLMLANYAFEGIVPNEDNLTDAQFSLYSLAQAEIASNIKKKWSGQKGGSTPKKPAKKGKGKSKPKEEPKPEPEEVKPEETRIDDSDDTYSTDADGESQKWKERQRQKEQEKREK
jgi:hypothetical protein